MGWGHARSQLLGAVVSVQKVQQGLWMLRYPDLPWLAQRRWEGEKNQGPRSERVVQSRSGEVK